MVKTIAIMVGCVLLLSFMVLVLIAFVWALWVLASWPIDSFTTGYPNLALKTIAVILLGVFVCYEIGSVLVKVWKEREQA